MRLGKRERAVVALERTRTREARERAALVPDHGGKYASSCGMAPLGGHMQTVGWSSWSARQIGYANRRR